MLPSHSVPSPLLSEEMLGLPKGLLEPPLPNQQCLLPGQAGTRARVPRLSLCHPLPSHPALPSAGSGDKESHRVTSGSSLFLAFLPLSGSKC